ncbi:MAG: hypothetical protein HQ551_07870 [Desulfobacteraceae bacterium]|nr:hypothetical protein [Desulfobacteraceae bacterium]
MATYYQDISKEVSPTAYYYGDNNLLWDLQENSRIGAKIKAGYGAVSFKDDVPGAGRDPPCSYYLQAVITVAKGFYITPEIGIFDYEHDGAGNDEGDVTYYGIQWKISF